MDIYGRKVEFVAFSDKENIDDKGFYRDMEIVRIDGQMESVPWIKGRNKSGGEFLINMAKVEMVILKKEIT